MVADPTREQVSAAVAGDALDAAIAAASAPPPMAEIPIKISSTGRPAFVALPVDVTDAEALEVMGLIPRLVLELHRKADELDPSRRLVSAAGGRLKT